MAGNKRAQTEALDAVEARRVLSARLVAGGEGQARSVTLSGSPLSIGKSRSAGLRVDDPHVSRIHAQVTLTTQGVLIEDLGSSNGTFVNGAAIDRAVVTHDAVITVGKSDLRLVVGPSQERASFAGAIGSSEQMAHVFAVLQKLAGTEVTVTLIGETGTGKDVLARALHRGSARHEAPFEVFDCGAVAPNLVESDLFGHQKGAFTGALDDREGIFERADRGTVFLDEIGELPLELQPRLLRVLEQRQVQRVGGDRAIGVDVRVVAATNRDLEEEVEAGRFRRDLYFRLNAAVVHVPPLRERLDDLPALVELFVAESGRPLQVAPETLETLRAYDWPGNVRELKNVVTSAAALADGATLEPRHLLFFKRRGGASRGDETLDRLPLAGRTLEMLERAAIKQTLGETGGNKSKAARVLGIAASTLYEKIKKYGL
jgi:DNA-binding NtrC family response regulator